MAVNVVLVLFCVGSADVTHEPHDQSSDDEMIIPETGGQVRPVYMDIPLPGERNGSVFAPSSLY